MRFQTQLLEAIERGEKTVTRRIMRDRMKFPYKAGNIYKATNRPRWDISGRKTNESKDWKSIPIKVISIHDAPLGAITEQEAIEEGFKPKGYLTARDQFLIMWGKIHGFNLNEDSVWVIQFQRVPESWA